jgi:hypothetical protein
LLYRLQIVLGQHPGEIGTADLMEQLKTRAECLFDRRARMQVSVFMPPSCYRVIGVGGIMLGEPAGRAVVVGIPVEVVHEKPPARAEQPGDGGSHGLQLGVVERHDGGDSVKYAEP